MTAFISSYNLAKTNNCLQFDMLETKVIQKIGGPDLAQNQFRLKFFFTFSACRWFSDSCILWQKGTQVKHWCTNHSKKKTIYTQQHEDHEGDDSVLPSWRAQQTVALWWPWYTLMASPVAIVHNLAVESEEAVCHRKIQLKSENMCGRKLIA